MKRIGGVFGVLVLSGLGLASPSPAAPAGLQAEYTFAEASGLAGGDSSGNGFDSTLQNGAAFAAGRIGNGIAFDGINDFVNLGDNRSYVQNTSAATVALWIKPSSIIPSGAFRDVVSLSVGSASATTTSRIAVALKGDGTTAGDLFAGGRSTDTEGQKTLQSDSNTAVGTWTHVVAVLNFSGNAIQIFRNGTLLATNAAAGFAQGATANTPSRSCALGAQDTGTSNFYQGSMDQVKIYNRALSASEIEALASGD